jgi:hypothetical protein
MLYQLIVYVPATHAEAVKNALFDAGAGYYENYDRCCWESPGTGQFRALEGSNPAIGHHGIIEKVEEIKIETVCTESVIINVLKALKEAHPYEEPAYGVIGLKTIEDF